MLADRVLARRAQTRSGWPVTPTTALDGGEYDYDQNYDDIYDDIGGIYDSCDDYNYNYDSDPADDR